MSFGKRFPDDFGIINEANPDYQWTQRIKFYPSVPWNYKYMLPCIIVALDSRDSNPDPQPFNTNTLEIELAP